MVIETKEELLKSLEIKRKFKSRDIKKLINSTFLKDICHTKGVKISEEAIKELVNMNLRLLNDIIRDTKEMGYKVVLRRHVENHI